MSEKIFLSTKEVAEFLDVNEKMVYALIAEKGLPATKVTGKWLFPRQLVEQWVASHIPQAARTLSAPAPRGVLVLAGSHDLLLDRVLALFNQRYPEHLAVFANVGSLGGVKALSQGLCQIASSHLLHTDEADYNFEFLSQAIGSEVAAVVNFCQREQGLLVAKGNPRNLQRISDLGNPGIRIANRPVGTGTRLLFDRELHKVHLDGATLDGYQREFGSHADVAIEVLTGRADAAPAIRAAANLFGLDFLPIRWERYDFLIAKQQFFQPDAQFFLSLLREEQIAPLALELGGYDLSSCGKMMFSQSLDREDSC